MLTVLHCNNYLYLTHAHFRLVKHLFTKKQEQRIMLRNRLLYTKITSITGNSKILWTWNAKLSMHYL